MNGQSLNGHALNGGAPALGLDKAELVHQLRGLSMIDTPVSLGALRQVKSREDFTAAFRKRELATEAKKRELAADWVPEYMPISIQHEGADLEHAPYSKAIKVSPNLILQDVSRARKTKIVCTLGPACWSEEGLSKLLDAGLDVARFNFSHGGHEDHQKVLDRMRKVATEKGKLIGYALDTKGPEIRTAMLKDGKDIQLVAGQELIVVGVGADYTTWEGYKDEKTGETKIGLSYGKLCQFLKPGNQILLADGTVSIEVLEILNDKELRGKVLNDKKLGQRKNCNLPGVIVDLPVLQEKDVDDIKNFACKNDMDFIFASFVQTADDVKYIRKVLAEGGAPHIKIIVKIESQAGLENFDAILAATDGVMVARGDLAMEIPPEKVALAQKFMINKCLMKGKMVLCATQMMESMIENPMPVRSEMTDVANAVFDGTGAVMLSGETANGKYFDLVVKTMANIVQYAELGLDYDAQYSFIRFNNAQKEQVSPVEATLAGVSKSVNHLSFDTSGDGVISLKEGVIAVVLTRTGKAAELVAKYRPNCPVMVVSDNARVLRQVTFLFGQYPILVKDLSDADAAVRAGTRFAMQQKLANEGKRVIVVTGMDEAAADTHPRLLITSIGPVSAASKALTARSTEYANPLEGGSVPCMQTLRVSTDLILKPVFNHRSTKIIATLGPATWSKEKIASLLKAGVNVIRFNTKHQNKAENQKVFDLFRSTSLAVGSELVGGVLDGSRVCATMVSIKGPEIRSAKLRGHQEVAVSAGQVLTLVSRADEWTTFEGGVEADGSLTVGLSYRHVKYIKKGSILLLADGELRVEVTSVGETEVKGVALNASKLGEVQLVHVPRMQVVGDFLSDKDTEDVVFAATNSADYVTVPYVRSGADVEAVRKVLDENHAPLTKIIAQIDTVQGIENFNSILEAADGIFVSRGNLGMDIPPEKVCLAQKYIIQKANFVGKPVFVAYHLLDMMRHAPRPTRPEMTDIVNAVYDGADGLVLTQETSTGLFPELSVQTMSQIISDCEVAIDHYAGYNFIRNFTPKPLSTAESVMSSAVKAAIDSSAALIVLLSNTFTAVTLVAKYRPQMAVLLLTGDERVAVGSSAVFGITPVLLHDPPEDLETSVELAVKYAQEHKLIGSGNTVIVVKGAGNSVYLEVSEIAQAQTLALVGGKQAPELTHVSGYRGEDTISYRSTKVGLDLVSRPITTPRKTKIFCTLGPACWSEEGLGKLLDAGLNIARFNFSHGGHTDHQAVLDRMRKVATAKGSNIAYMLDTKGPEIRTAMLKDHKPIDLKAGLEVIIRSVGAEYITFEGYSDATATVIGLSYEHLCQDVAPGGIIKIADGTITIEVLEILNEKELKGRCLNDKTLGERKNCNLPGVQVKIAVLTEKDIDDVKNFACKNNMDLIAASFVQSADDVRFIRKVLKEGGGEHIKIISKIESWHGVINYDEILQESDGIMVARGDLAMEIPSEKVALAQKMMITKANIAGKFVLCATQMLESMITNPLPTRAEMTDVANAVWDGADAVMLSGESANGKFPDTATATLAAIVANAEVGTNYYQVYDFIRNFTAKPMTPVEAVVSGAAENAIDLGAGLVVVVSSTGEVARLVSKYRPPVPVLVVTEDERVVRACAPVFALYPYRVAKLPNHISEVAFDVLLESAIISAVQSNLCPPGTDVIVVHGASKPASETGAVLTTRVAPGKREATAKASPKTLSLRTTAISMSDILDYSTPPRKTKIYCTLGPACWSEEGLAKLLDAGLNIARFNFSHGNHAGHQEVLDRIRKVATAKGKGIAYLLDTKGPEIRTAMLKDGKNVDLEAGQDVILVAVGEAYETWEGYKDDATGETKLGCSYAKLVQSVKPGGRILIADGTVVLEVVKALNDTELLCKCLNTKSLGQRKNMNLPGVHVDIPVLTDKDIDDLQNFCVKNNMDFVAASFVQSADDVRFIRNVLDAANGHQVKIICKIENEAGLENFDDILKETDGIMVARGDLAMEIPSEKVALAQKMMITKANIAGKFVVTATQMLESMITNPLPTRAEMTDVANAVFDGTDAVMLSGESANGAFPDTAVATMRDIVKNAENANSYFSTANFIADFSKKPMTRTDTVGSCVNQVVTDSNADIIVTLSSFGVASRMVSKYRPAVPQVVVTDLETVARQTNAVFGQYALLVPELDDEKAAVDQALAFATEQELWEGHGIVVVVSGQQEPSADRDPAFRVVDRKSDLRLKIRAVSFRA